MTDYRIEHDTMGDIKVPAEHYWGAQTERSLENFRIGVRRMPKGLIDAFAVLKKAAAIANGELGALDEDRRKLIVMAANEILEGKLGDEFPLVIYQTGSGTQTNMNVNEVIANRGNEIAESEEDGDVSGKKLHPNDHVNMSQSSNDIFPTAMNIAAYLTIKRDVIPSVKGLRDTLKVLEEKYMDIIKTGRTHLQDATPITLGQEISGWRSMMDHDLEAVKKASEGLNELAIGGTAVGTGLNCPKGFPEKVTELVSEYTEEYFKVSDNKFHALTSRDAYVFCHGALKALAADLMKIANDVRMLASGPRCGIGELRIPENEPGSSIMPGKVNPTQCEAVTMVTTRVMGNDTTIGVAASQGNFELNVFAPVIIDSFLESAELLSDVMRSFDEHCVSGIEPVREVIEKNLEQSLMLVTALSPHIGYEKAAEIAKKAFSDGTTLREAASALGYVSEEDFDKWVDPGKMV